MSVSTTSLLLLLLAPSAYAQQSRLGEITSNNPDGPEADWFPVNNAEPMPLHPFRMRSALRTHPKQCPPGTTYQSTIYAMWSDNATQVPNLQAGTITWGGCYPHMQILYKGDRKNQWPVVIWKSINIPGMNEKHSMGSDIPFTAMHNLDPCHNGQIDDEDRVYDTCTQQGGVIDPATWQESMRFPVRDPTTWRWGPYVPPPKISIPGNWTPYALDPNKCGYVMYCPRSNGDGLTSYSTVNPDGCPPQWNDMPELPIQWGWGPLAQQKVARTQSSVPINIPNGRVASLSARADTIGPLLASAGVATSQGSQMNGCNRFGPNMRQVTGIGADNIGYSRFTRPRLRGDTTPWPPPSRTCTFRDIHFMDVSALRGFPYNYSRLGMLMSARRNWYRESDRFHVNFDGGFSFIMHADPGNLYGMRNLDYYHKYGELPNAIWQEAWHTGADAYLMSVVKPVWNIPMGGILYWLVTMRGCNADRGGSVLDSWQVSIDGQVERGKQGYLVGQSTGAADDIANLLINATALGLQPGWHTLEVHMNQRSTVPETLGQPRKMVTKHMFEIIDDPIASGRCTDFITYPFFQADYRTNHDRNGAVMQMGGLGNWDTTRINQYWWDNRIIRTNNLLQFDMSWMRTRRQLRAATLYLGYLGQRNPTTKTSVRVSVFAVSNAILPARWYDTTWDPNGDVPIPGWNWRDAGVEARLQRVGGFTVRLNQKQGMWTRSQYIPVALNVTWLNQFQSAQRRAFTLVMRPDEDTETEINFSNLWGFSNGPGGVAPFIRMVPLHSLCSGIRA